MNEISLDISHILSQLLKTGRITEYELANKIKIPRATINRITSGRTPDPRASTLQAIAAYFNITVDQLIGKQPLSLESPAAATLSRSHQGQIPIIEWKDALSWQLGSPRSSAEAYSGWINIDSSIEQAQFALKVTGDSMWPQFPADTILIISPKVPEKNRNFVIAYIHQKDEVLFRQLILEDGYRFLKAINTIFPTIPLEKTDRIIGTVIQTRSNYSQGST